MRSVWGKKVFPHRKWISHNSKWQPRNFNFTSSNKNTFKLVVYEIVKWWFHAPGDILTPAFIKPRCALFRAFSLSVWVLGGVLFDDFDIWMPRLRGRWKKSTPASLLGLPSCFSGFWLARKLCVGPQMIQLCNVTPQRFLRCNKKQHTHKLRDTYWKTWNSDCLLCFQKLWV